MLLLFFFVCVCVCQSDQEESFEDEKGMSSGEIRDPKRAAWLLKETKLHLRPQCAGDQEVTVMKVEMVIRVKVMKMKGSEGEEKIVNGKGWWK